MKPAKTILFAVLALTAVYSATKVLGGAPPPPSPPEERPEPFPETPPPATLCVTCGKPSELSSKAFPMRQQENLKLLEERLNALYPRR
jgi:hypothetical protein